MTKAELLKLLEYHYWVTYKVLMNCTGLSEKETHTPAGGAFGTLFATLVHMLSAEDIWLSRWQGKTDPGFAPPQDYTDIKHITREWRGQQERIETFLAKADTDTILNIRGYNHPLFELVLHMIDHSTFHRGQIVMMLRNMGKTPPQKANLVNFLRSRQD